MADLGFSLALAMGVRVTFSKYARNEFGLQVSLERSAMDEPTVFTIQAEAVDELVIPLLILDGLALTINSPFCEILLAFDDILPTLNFQLSAKGFGIQLPTLLFKRATPGADGSWTVVERAATH